MKNDIRDPVEVNAQHILTVMIEQNIRNCNNSKLQELTGIEDGYDVNDALEWLEERGAAEIKWLRNATGVPLAYVTLKGKGTSLYHRLVNQATHQEPETPVYNVNFNGSVGNIAMGSRNFEQHAAVSKPAYAPDANPSINAHSDSSDAILKNSMPNAKPPSAMISYTWEDEDHKLWVKELAARLRTEGVSITLDQWHTTPGDQLPQFMETAIRENEYILVICTPTYKDKSDNRRGGAGYEGDIMTGEAVNSQNKRKFIPILRKGEWNTALPSWMGGKYGIDLRGEPYSEAHYDDLLKTLHALREQAPPIGQVPQRLIKSNTQSGNLQ